MRSCGHVVQQHESKERDESNTKPTRSPTTNVTQQRNALVEFYLRILCHHFAVQYFVLLCGNNTWTRHAKQYGGDRVSSPIPIPTLK